MAQDSIVYHISSVGRALRSSFPQESIFDQLVSSDLIKMIESEELTMKLFIMEKIFLEDTVVIKKTFIISRKSIY